MKKNIIWLCIVVIFLTGCTKENDELGKEAKSNLETSDVAYIDESDFSQSLEEQDVESWINGYNAIITDLSDIEWVDSISITPISYEEYIDEGECIITCSVNNEAPDEDDIKETIENYMDSANVITNYELIIIK